MKTKLKISNLVKYMTDIPLVKLYTWVIFIMGIAEIIIFSFDGKGTTCSSVGITAFGMAFMMILFYGVFQAGAYNQLYHYGVSRTDFYKLSAIFEYLLLIGVTILQVLIKFIASGSAYLVAEFLDEEISGEMLNYISAFKYVGVSFVAGSLLMSVIVAITALRIHITNRFKSRNLIGIMTFMNIFVITFTMPLVTGAFIEDETINLFVEQRSFTEIIIFMVVSPIIYAICSLLRYKMQIKSDIESAPNLQ